MQRRIGLYTRCAPLSRLLFAADVPGMLCLLMRHTCHEHFSRDEERAISLYFQFYCPQSSWAIV